MNAWKTDRISFVMVLASFIFICHFLEESPGFVEWFNSHVPRGITQEMFWSVNIYGLIITLIVVLIERFSRSALSLIIAVAWFGSLMFANSLFHIAGSLIDSQYVPGLVTSVLLYIPYFAWLFINAVKSKLVNVALLIAAAVLGSSPMLLHCYFILFRGSRLF